MEGFTPWLCLSAVICCFGSPFLFGYNIGVLNTPATIIISFYNETYTARSGEVPEKTYLEFMWSLTVAIFVAAGMFGAFVSGLVSEKFGPKMGLVFNHSFMIIGSILEGITLVTKTPELLIVGRAVVGFSCGLLIGISGMYLTEISPRKLRGAMGVCNQLAITMGIMFAQIFGLKEILGGENLWPVLVGINGIPAAISLFIFPFCPESPQFLLVKKRNAEAATSALRRLRNTQNVHAELDEMNKEAKEGNTGGNFKFCQIFSRELRFPLLICVILQVAQQWSGINAIFFYSEVIFKSAGLSSVTVQYAILGTGVINVLTTVVSVPLIEKLGRRPLLIGPMIMMAISLIIITITLKLQYMADWLKFISIVCVIAYVIGFAIGLGPIPLFVASEVFRQEPRATAMSISLFVNWTCNFILALTFRFMQVAMGAFTFLLFLGIIVGSIIFIAIFVPETKNRSVDDIAKDLAFGRQSGTLPFSSQSMLLHEGVRKDAVKTSAI